MSMDLKSIRSGMLIELRDTETGQWLPLTIISVVFDNVECRTLANKPILTTTTALWKNARLRPHNGSCADCGDDAHVGTCIERCCSECGAKVVSRCSVHPRQPVHVYLRDRYLAEIVKDKPYPTREQSEALRRDLITQMHTLRSAEEPRQGRVMIKGTDRADILSAIENAVALIDALPSPHKRRSS